MSEGGGGHSLPQPRGRSRWRVETRQGAPRRSAESTVFPQDLASGTSRRVAHKDQAQLPNQQDVRGPQVSPRPSSPLRPLPVQQVGPDAAPGAWEPLGPPWPRAGSSPRPGAVPATLPAPFEPRLHEGELRARPGTRPGHRLSRQLVGTEMAGAGDAEPWLCVTP